MSLTHQTTMAAAAQARVISQYRDSPIFFALIGDLGEQAQDLEDAFWDLYNAAFLASATDIWLDYIGAIVGEDREGWDDTNYRRFIQARVLANKSNGTINEVLAIASKVMGVDVTLLFESADEYYPASWLIVIDPGVLPSGPLRNRLCRIVAKGRPAAVRLLINSNESDVTAIFTLCDAGDPQPVLDARLGLGDDGNPGDGGHFASGDLA